MAESKADADRQFRRAQRIIVSPAIPLFQRDCASVSRRPFPLCRSSQWLGHVEWRGRREALRGYRDEIFAGKLVALCSAFPETVFTTSLIPTADTLAGNRFAAVILNLVSSQTFCGHDCNALSVWRRNLDAAKHAVHIRSALYRDSSYQSGGFCFCPPGGQHVAARLTWKRSLADTPGPVIFLLDFGEAYRNGSSLELVGAVRGTAAPRTCGAYGWSMGG